MVHGHLTADTVWSVDNNPYIIDGFLYVDEGVTLTIQPGVQIKVYAADANTLGAGFTWVDGQEPAAKLIDVYGKIIALGTEEQPIVFDRYQENDSWRWGGIFMTSSAPRSFFEYCEFRNTAGGYRTPTSYLHLGALDFQNADIHVRHCKFVNNIAALACYNMVPEKPLLVYDCTFYDLYNVNFIGNYAGTCFSLSGNMNYPPDDFADVTIAKCTFDRNIHSYVSGYYMKRTYLFNQYLNSPIINLSDTLRHEYGPSNMYGNYCFNSSGLFVTASSAADTAYCRRNTNIYTNSTSSIGGGASVGGNNGGNVYFADNYLSGSIRVSSNDVEYLNAYIYNNTIFTSAVYAIEFNSSTNPIPDSTRVFNNTFISLTPENIHQNAFLTYLDQSYFFNNTFYGFYNFLAINDNQIPFSNNIIYNGNHIVAGDNYNSDLHPMFSSNCFDPTMPSLWSCVDGGGNIYANPMFADTLNNDFTLQAGSPCIDSGTTLNWLPAFDANYNQRIAGSAPDMGAYEYNSQYIGGIVGNVYDAITLRSIDCAKISIAGKLPEFSDLSGSYTYPTGAGTYTVKVSRWDYQDVLIPNVTVIPGQHTILTIPLQMTTSADDNISPVPAPTLSMYNFPNPFNLETNINFILPEKGKVKLEIYNLKGQKVKTLVNSIKEKGLNQTKWDGKDNCAKTVSSGVYFCIVETEKHQKTIKMLLLR